MPGSEAAGPAQGGAGNNGGDSARDPVPSVMQESSQGSARQEGRGPRGKRAVVVALGANLGIAVTKFVAFLITGSASLLAEAVHSVADSGNQVLLLLGRRRARRAETEEHQFGFGAERYFYAFIVALVLFTVGALFSSYEGIQRIRHPGELTSPVVALAVLGIAILLESFSLRTAITESNRSRGRVGWRSFIRRAKAPELPAVLLEDVAALCGLGLALVGVTLATITHNDRWDGAGSLAIGVLLGCVAVVLAIEMKSLLIGESASFDVAGCHRCRHRGRPRHRAGHSPAHIACRTGNAAGRGEDRSRARRHRRKRRRGHRCRRATDSCRRSDRRAHLPGTRHLPGGTGQPGRSGGEGCPAFRQATAAQD